MIKLPSPLQGQIALITGAAGGIGAAACEVLASQGCHLVLMGRNESRLLELEQALAKTFPQSQSLSVAGDVGEESTWGRAFSQAEARWGGVDLLINNAGDLQICPLVDTSLELWDQTQNSNLRGSFLGCREMLRQAKRLKRGAAIVNISSLAGIRGVEKFPGTSAYVAAKHGVVGLTEVAALEGKAYGLRVNCIAPGAVDTPLMHRVAPHLRTSFKPHDVAELILYFCDPQKSGKITGSIWEIFSNE